MYTAIYLGKFGVYVDFGGYMWFHRNKSIYSALRCWEYYGMLGDMSLPSIFVLDEVSDVP